MATEKEKNIQDSEQSQLPADVAPSASTPAEKAPSTGDTGDTASAAPAPEESAADSAPSARERFRSRIAEDYPDLDIDDEDAYYENANQRYDELKGLKDNVRNFREALSLDSDKTGLFNDMIAKAAEQKDFDPVVYLVENGVDIQEAMSDPDYARKIGEARQKYLDEVNEGESLSSAFEENAPKSMEEIDRYCSENGVSAEQKSEIIGKMYDIVDNLVIGKMPVELFEFCRNGLTHDSDVDEAKEAGKAEGKSQKVSQKLRKLGGGDRVSGRQAPVGDAPAPKGNEQNMFGL